MTAGAMLRFDECGVMVDQSINAHSGHPRDSILSLYPADVVEYHRHVRSNGLDVPDLEVTFFGLTEFRINDPDGNRLWIGQNAIERCPTKVCSSIPNNLRSQISDFKKGCKALLVGAMHHTALL